ncbi:MAG TPA: gluconeogenesis factor YvcK family protein [Terriglobales bacterium]|nr:gluconeogenesis factor YvcK family protein [Terriglobales bacterium]
MERAQKPRREERALKVVSIGGGTGLSTLLRGLKNFVAATALHAQGSEGPEGRMKPAIADLTAVVTVTDDGGSSGKLRKEFNILPPGDIRNCIVALSEDEALLSRLFKYRFPGQSALAGHNFGNLFLTALTAITGDFAEAVRLSAGVLVSRGHIYPATTANCELEALMDDGTRVRGETSITASKRRIRQLTMIPGDVKPMPQTLEAIRQADLITIGPGSLFTSLISNVLVRGIPEAIANSAATKVFVCNLMTQANESLGLSAADHIRAIYEHAGVDIFDYALINVKPASPEMKAKYALEGASQIAAQPETIESMGVRSVFGDFLLEDKGVARHDTDLVARELLQLAMRQSVGAGVPS